MTSKFTVLSKRLFCWTPKRNAICPPPDKKKPCDCPPPDMHKDCRDNLSKNIMSQKSASKKKQSDHEKAAYKWKIITCFMALPLVIGMSISTLLMGDHENVVRTPFVEYDHMYIRTRPFPFGDGKRSFFHNPCVNALPGIGYEYEKCPSYHEEKEEEEEEEEEEAAEEQNESDEGEQSVPEDDE